MRESYVDFAKSTVGNSQKPSWETSFNWSCIHVYRTYGRIRLSKSNPLHNHRLENGSQQDMPLPLPPSSHYLCNEINEKLNQKRPTLKLIKSSNFIARSDVAGSVQRWQSIQ